MFKRIILFFVLMTALHAESFNAAHSYTEDEIKKMIGSMLVVGFDEESVSKESEIYRYIKQYDLGGVILFDRFYSEGKKVKNIRNPRQLQKLTAQLQSISEKNLIISVDQEGGPVARLKKKYGFGATPGAAKIGRKDDPEFAEKAYRSLARELSDNGINCNFAPVVDLSVNPENNVIVKRGRSFGRSPEKVTQYATIIMFWA